MRRARDVLYCSGQGEKKDRVCETWQWQPGPAPIPCPMTTQADAGWDSKETHMHTHAFISPVSRLSLKHCNGHVCLDMWKLRERENNSVCHFLSFDAKFLRNLQQSTSFLSDISPKDFTFVKIYSPSWFINRSWLQKSSILCCFCLFVFTFSELFYPEVLQKHEKKIFMFYSSYLVIIYSCISIN